MSMGKTEVTSITQGIACHKHLISCLKLILINKTLKFIVVVHIIQTVAITDMKLI
jgi:hypothetical protein